MISYRVTRSEIWEENEFVRVFSKVVGTVVHYKGIARMKKCSVCIFVANEITKVLTLPAAL